jgi:uncharacterized protein YfbU (UPF0304 family)
MQLSNAERLMLAMLCEIHEASRVRNGINSALIRKALESGNDWAIPTEVNLPWRDEPATPPHVTHVLDILDMWSTIEDSYAALTADETARYASETGHTYDPQFPGFHEHSEFDEHTAAQFLIDHMGRFSTFAGRSLVSDQPTIARGRRMLAAFVPIRATLGNRNPVLMTADEIIAVIKA